MLMLSMKVRSVFMGCLGLCLFVTQAQAYRNPARGVYNMGDPSVLKHNGVYYMYATTGVFNDGNSAGIQCWSSSDLMNWQPRGWAFLVTPTTWAQRHLNGPDVHFKNGKFLMYFSARPGPGLPLRPALAESSSPTGPFTEIKTPLFEDGHVFDLHMFEDTDGRAYVYYVATRSSSYNAISVIELSADRKNVIGTPYRDILATPFLPWEQNKDFFPIVEAPHIHKRNGIYYLIYSGSGFEESTYAVGYATASSPIAVFTRYAGNPIMTADMNSSAPVSGPGSGHVTTSPDGSELFYLYNAHTDAVKRGDSRALYIDRIFFDSQGVLHIAGPTRTCQPDPSSAGAGTIPPTTCPVYTGEAADPLSPSTGWVHLHTQIKNFADATYDFDKDDVTATVVSDPLYLRRTGVMSHQSQWLPYSAIGADNYVRARFSVYRSGQSNPNNLNQVPNLRFRAATRFALTAITEVFHHLNVDPAATKITSDTIPSADPSRPSVYTVDFDPIDVPALINTPGEGVMRGFEAYALEPQEQGSLTLAESSIGVYPRTLLPDHNSSAVLRKVYAPSLNDAGNLRSMVPGDKRLSVFTQPSVEGFPPSLLATNDTSAPLYYEAGLNSTNPPAGVTMDATNVWIRRVGAAERDFFPGADPSASDYMRVYPGRQYKIRFHLTSTVPASRNAIIRVRARTLRWGWIQRLDMGGAFAAGPVNNAITQELLPGIGSKNPDKQTPGEAGGWYTMLFTGPLDPDIRPEFNEGTPLEVRMPNIMKQPGPGVNAPSLRDIKLGMDLVDSTDLANGYQLETGHVTIDRIEIRSHPRIPD